MKKNKNTRGGYSGVLILSLLMLVLAFLTAATLTMILTGASVKSSVPFDLDEITAANTSDSFVPADLFIPEMIGITADNNRYASSVSAMTTSELYKTVLPVLAEVLNTNGTPDTSEMLWDTFIERKSSVYIRFHRETANYVICSLADIASPTMISPVYELFLLPYSSNSDSMTAAVKCYDGSVYVYTKRAPENIITEDELAKLLTSYTSALTPFSFLENGEPVFTASLSSRNIIITDGTASMLGNDKNVSTLLRLFGLNPDKLLNKHISSDGTGSYIAQKGIFTIERSSFSFTASQDGGVRISDHISASVQPSFKDYVSAAYAIFESIGEINSHFTGDDADIILASASSSADSLTLVFEYVFDNIRIVDIEPALTVTFTNGKLTEYNHYTLSVRNLGSHSQSVSKKWFADFLNRPDGKHLHRISLVYRGDFLSESVKAEWCGIEYPTKEN